MNTYPITEEQYNAIILSHVSEMPYFKNKSTEETVNEFNVYFDYAWVAENKWTEETIHKEVRYIACYITENDPWIDYHEDHDEGPYGGAFSSMDDFCRFVGVI